MASAAGAIVYTGQSPHVASLPPPPPAVLHRRSANYQPNTWDYDSICSLHLQQQDHDEKASKQSSLEAARLKQIVRQVLLKEEEPATRLRTMDQLQSLGVAYHFEEEMKSILMSMHAQDAHLQLKHDLPSTALLFRMLRGHGIPASTDMLSAFRDENNGGSKAANYPKDMDMDMDGFIALYEASYLAFPGAGEAILDEARAFAMKNLQKELVEPSMEPNQRERLPLHWRAPRLQAIWSLKEHHGNNNGGESCLIIDPSILQLATVDFNLVQSVHRAELAEVTKWWKETWLGEMLPFARDRVVECFFCAACIAPEPSLAGCREVLAKVGSLVVHLDDVYDLYGTLDELAAFTDAIGTWDASAAAALPEYMKAMYSAIWSTSTGAAARVMKEQGYDVLPLYKKAWHELCKAFLVEAKWQHERCMPRLDEYLDNGWVTSTGPLLLLHAFPMFQLQHIDDSWLRNSNDDDDGGSIEYPRLVELCSRIFRLCNDRATHEAESERGDAPSSIACYMAESGASEEEARGAVSDAIAETWKELNREATSCTGGWSNVCVNLARITHCIYHDGNDGITSPTDTRKLLVKDLLFNPILCHHVTEVVTEVSPRTDIVEGMTPGIYMTVH